MRSLLGGEAINNITSAYNKLLHYTNFNVIERLTVWNYNLLEKTNYSQNNGPLYDLRLINDRFPRVINMVLGV